MEDRGIRKNVTISKEVAKWYELKAKQTGMSQSSIMALALSNYIKDDESVKNVISIDDFIDKMQEIRDQQTGK